MGKKKNVLMKLAKKSIKILDNDKIKLRKGEKISIKPFVEKSLEGAVVSRLEGIIDDNTEKYDVNHVVSIAATTLTSTKMSAIIAHTRDKDTASIPTIVHVVTKKNALDFDFSAPGLIGDILRTSTLGPVYQRIKTEWKSLNTNDESNFTNIMYIPNLYVFSDGNESLFYPFKINLLIVSVPTCKRHKEEISDDTINPATDYIGRVIGDIMESASKISGCDELIVDPYELKITKDYPQEVINMWNYVMSTPKIKKSINKVWFTIDDEYNYVLFVANSVTKLSSILTKTAIDNVHPDEDDEDDDNEDDDITNEIVSSINQSNHDKTVIIESLSESDVDD